MIVNEFGAVGIDDALVRDSADETVLLGNGCVCCITRTDLQVALRRLVFDRERGTVPRFARVVIETSGLADPAPILQTFSTDRALGGEFHIDVVLAVVDAVNGAMALDERARGAQAGDPRRPARDLENRSRGAGRGRAADARLQRLNPRAAIDIAVAGALDPSRIIEPAAGERRASSPRPSTATASRASSSRQRHSRSTGRLFARAMETLIALRGADLLRVKGILNVKGCRGPVVVQYVQHLAHPPVELQSWPDDNRNSRVVFITRGVAERDVHELCSRPCRRWRKLRVAANDCDLLGRGRRERPALRRLVSSQPSRLRPSP